MHTPFRKGCYGDGNAWEPGIYGYGWPLWSWRFS